MATKSLSHSAAAARSGGPPVWGEKPEEREEISELFEDPGSPHRRDRMGVRRWDGEAPLAQLSHPL